MNCRVEETNTCGRKLHIAISATDYNEQINQELRKLSTTAKLKGFRPGKAPIDVIKRYYGKEVEQEAVNTLLLQSYKDALEQHSFQSVVTPSFDDIEIDKDKGISYTAYIEIIPDLQLTLEDIPVEKPTCEITEADIDTMVQRVRKNYAKWQPKTDTARIGDKLTVDISSQEKTDTPTEKLTDQTIVLGSHALGEDVDSRLEHIRVGEEREIEIKSSGSSDETLRYSVRVKAVEEQILPELNDDFYKACGIKEGGLASLRDLLRKGMQHELDKKLAQRFRENLKDSILEHNDIEVPPSMLKERIKSMKARVSENNPAADSDKQTIVDKFFEETASRYVRLHILFLYLAGKHNLTADRRACEAKIAELALDYAEPEKMINYYRSDANAYQTIQTMVIEDQTMDLLIEKAHSSDKKYSFYEIIDPVMPETDQGADKEIRDE